MARAMKKVAVQEDAGGRGLSPIYLDDIEEAFKNGLHPMDLKGACTKYLIEYLTPVRDHFEKNPDALKVFG